MDSRSSSTAATFAAAGLAGGLLGAATMNLFARAAGDREGHGMQPPQAAGVAQPDAAERVGTIAFEAATGEQPARTTARRLGVASHYAFAGSLGVVYGLLASRLPAIRRGYGCLYGGLVWAVADEGAMPAMGLSRGPRELPWSVHAYALLGHCVFGATLEAVVRGVAGKSHPI